MEDELKGLQETMRRRQAVQEQLDMVRRQKETMLSMLPQLEEAARREQGDVDRIQDGTLGGFFYGALGQQRSRLEKEEREANAAMEKLLSAEEKIRELEEQEQTLQDDLSRIPDCRDAYYAALRRKQAHMDSDAEPASAPGGADEVRRLQARIAENHRYQQEIQEAAQAGMLVLRRVESIQRQLGGAEAFGAWDLFGGGMISGIAKHSKMNRAQREIEELQQLLRAYQKELQDLNLYLDVQASASGGMEFADLFFDNAIFDFMTMDHIEDSKRRMAGIKEQVNRFLGLVHQRDGENRREEAQLQAELEAAIVDS